MIKSVMRYSAIPTIFAIANFIVDSSFDNIFEFAVREKVTSTENVSA
jgi:hypothetical protein